MGDAVLHLDLFEKPGQTRVSQHPPVAGMSSVAGSSSFGSAEKLEARGQPYVTAA
jgi:hypothetical protein